MDVKFKAYCDCSNLLWASPLVQQQVTLGFVDSNLNSYLSGKLDPRTPLFGVDCHALEAAQPEPGSLLYYLGEKFKAIPHSGPGVCDFSKWSSRRTKPGQSKWEEAFRNTDMEPYLVGGRSCGQPTHWRHPRREACRPLPEA